MVNKVQLHVLSSLYVIRLYLQKNGNEKVLHSVLWLGVGGFPKVVATFNNAGGSFNLFMATTGDVWIIPSFQIWDYMLDVEHVSCVIVNCGQTSMSHPFPDSKVHRANMGPIWCRQDPDGPQVGPMNFAIWVWLWWRKTLPENFYPYL